MKEQKITRTIEEVNGYIADDGTWFKNKEQCLEYEASAKMVVYNMVKEKMIGKTDIQNLFGEGDPDSDVEIFLVDSMNTLELLNRYVYLYTYDKKENLVSTDMIGKKIIICWSYDKDYCWCKGTIEDVLKEIRESYEKVINKTETN